MKYTLLILILILVLAGNAQNKNFWDNINVKSNRLEGKLTGTIYHLTANGNINYFLHSDWFEGTVLLEDGDLFEKIKMRYLAFGDELVIFNDRTKKLFVADKPKVNSFIIHTINGNLHFKKLYWNGIGPGYKYFEEVYKGTNSLVAFHHIDKLKTSMYRDEHGRLKDTRFDLFTNYYMYSEEDGFRRIYESKNSFLKLFADHRREVRKLFRKHGIREFDKNGIKQAFILIDKAGFMK